MGDDRVEVHADDIVSVLIWSNTNWLLGCNLNYNPKGGGGPRTLALPNVSTGATRAIVSQQSAPIQADGFVDALAVYVAGGTEAPQRGQTYVQVLLSHGALSSTGVNVVAVLASGYVYFGHALALGEKVEPGPAGGHGYLVAANLGSPAAGADYPVLTIPTGALWRIRGMAGQLVTAVAAFTRFFHIIVKSYAGNILTEFVADSSQITSLTYNYRGVFGVSPKTTATPNATGGEVLVSIPETLIFVGGSLTPTTDNIQGGDQWSATGILYLEEWVMPN